jgi:hypothetical protein
VSTTRPSSATRYVFVVTYGRSGSTLTQGMLNALPRTLVRGENNLFLLPVFRSWSGLRAFQTKFAGSGNPKTTSAFYGLHELDMVRFAAGVRELVRVQLLGSTRPEDVDRLGFKEVLWHRLKPREWEEFFEFMDLAFEDPLYVLNQRDIEMASTSGFWRSRKPGVALQQITRIRKLQGFLRESRPERCYDTRFEVTTGEDRDAAAASLRGLAEFVTGSCDDALLDTMMALREVGHGPNPFGKVRSD